MKDVILKNRVGYIDALRGIAILFVVFGHLELFSYQTASIAEDPFLSFITTFNMPLFFFISGMLADKSKEWWQQISIMKIIGRKSLQLLIPTIFFSLLYNWHKCRPFLYFFINGSSEYWFTIVLFEIFMLYYGIICLTLNLKESVLQYLLVSVAMLGVVLFMMDLKIRILSGSPLLQLQNLCRFFSFFVLGVLCHKHSNSFEKLLSKDSFRTIILLLFAFLFIAFRVDLFLSVPFLSHFHIPVSFFHLLNYELLLKYVGLFAVFTLVFYYREVFEQQTIWSQALQTIGRYTLDIYMIQYFLLPDLPCLKQFFCSSHSLVLEFVITLLLSLLIVYFSMLISKIIRSSHYLGRILFAAK